MKKQYIMAVMCLCMGISACTSKTAKPETEAETPVVANADSIWKDYFVGNILFEDKAPQSEGSRIYRSLIPDAEAYISRQARTVLNTLYFSPEDSIIPVYNLHYRLEDIDGISAKGGEKGESKTHLPQRSYR